MSGMTKRSQRCFLWLQAILIAALLPTGEAIGYAAAPVQHNCDRSETQAQATVCAEQMLADAGGRLQDLYTRLVKNYPPASRRLLESAQQRWAEYRDAECAFENAATNGGTMHRQLVAQCLAREAERRMEELDTQLRCDIDTSQACNRPDQH